MKRLIQTIALGAALVVVSVGVWRDYAVDVTLKQAGIAYLAVYFVSGLLYLSGSAALRAAGDPPPEVDEEQKRKGSRNLHRPSSQKSREIAPEPTQSPVESQPEPVALQTDSK